MMGEFEQKLKETAERSLLKMIGDGNWVATDYSSRMKVPPEMISEVWQMVDFEKVKRAMADRIEQELADRIVNSMATEISTDIKQILSVKERREALRSLARANLDAICNPPEKK